MSGLVFGPPDGAAWHLCIDMQRIFLEPGDWYCPAGLEILPAIRRLAAHAPDRSAFTRFITAATPEEAGDTSIGTGSASHARRSVTPSLNCTRA